MATPGSARAQTPKRQDPENIRRGYYKLSVCTGSPCTLPGNGFAPLASPELREHACFISGSSHPASARPPGVTVSSFYWTITPPTVSPAGKHYLCAPPGRSALQTSLRDRNKVAVCSSPHKMCRNARPQRPARASALRAVPTAAPTSSCSPLFCSFLIGTIGNRPLGACCMPPTFSAVETPSSTRQTRCLSQGACVPAKEDKKGHRCM